VQALYARACAARSTFQEAPQRWWQRRRTPAADKAELARLIALEARLSLEEVAHFRAGVAATHSCALAASAAARQHAMDAVDAVVGTPLAVPAHVQSTLFQRCPPGPGQARASLLCVRVCLAVPKLGFQLAVGEEWLALTPRVPSCPFSSLEAAVRDVSLTLHSSGAP
jgi:hypothetical protein